MITKSLFPDDPSDHCDSAGRTCEAMDEPATYHNRTVPSKAAATSARAFSRTQAVRVSEFIHSRGEHGATDKEVQTALAMDGNSERPRRVWLREKGFITESGMLRNGCTVWVSVRLYAPEVEPSPATVAG